MHVCSRRVDIGGGNVQQSILQPLLLLLFLHQFQFYPSPSSPARVSPTHPAGDADILPQMFHGEPLPNVTQRCRDGHSVTNDIPKRDGHKRIIRTYVLLRIGCLALMRSEIKAYIRLTRLMHIMHFTFVAY